MPNQPGDNLKAYNVLQVLQHGHFNTCYKVQHRSGGPQLVLKAMDYSYLSESNRKELKAEVQVLVSVQHDNLVKWQKCITHTATSTLYVVMEFCEGGDIEQLIRKCQPSCNFVAESFLWKFLYQCARGLHAFHSRLPSTTLLHCDVKPPNIFLSANGNIKLGGFQLLNQPESVQQGKAASVCAVGQVLHMLASLSLSSSAERTCKLPPHYSSDLHTILAFCRELQPELHPSIDMILYHPLVVSHVALTSLARLTLDVRDDYPASGRSSAGSAEEKPCLRCKDMDAKFESLRQKETTLRAREASLKDREARVVKREKQAAALQKVGREQVLRAEVFLSQCRRPRRLSDTPEDLNDSSYSADPGDTSVLPTTSRLDPGKIQKPSFFNRRSVHFDTNNMEPIYNSIASQKGAEAVCPSTKEGKYSSSKAKYKKGKENMGQGVRMDRFNKLDGIANKQKQGKTTGSVLSLRTNTKEHHNGILETDLL